jgi:precorrin-6B methylase 2
MKNIIILLAIFISQYSWACRCASDRDLASIIASSKTVFIGETIGVERVGELVNSGEKQQYKITVSPVEIFKGKPRKKYVFEGSAFYNSKKSDEIMVGGCNRDMEMGEFTLVMLEPRNKIVWNWCSENLIYIDPKEYDKFLSEFKKNF